MNRLAAPPAPPSGRPARRGLLPQATALVLLAGVVGCRSTVPGGFADRKSSGNDDGGGPTLIPSPPSSPPLPTDPEPLPQLTSDRSVNVHLDLGRVFEARGQIDAAEGEYRRALEAVDRRVDRPTRGQVHRRLAAVLDRQGKFGDSATHHREATRLAAKDPRAWNDSGYSAYLQGDWPEAIRLLRTARKLAPEDARVLTNLGLALAASGQEDEAHALLAKAGGPAAAEANLAYVMAATGRADSARDHYREVLRLNPDNALARQAIGRLDASPIPAEAIASRPMPVDPAVAPASFQAIEPPAIPPPTDGEANPRRRGLLRRWWR